VFNSIDKLLRSNGTLILLSIILVPYLVYALFRSEPVKHSIKTVETKSIEEIIASQPTVDSNKVDWDSTFRSKIIPTNEK
jgi:K+-transporting ATPase KdpF subunit